MKFEVGQEYIYANKDKATSVRFLVEEVQVDPPRFGGITVIVRVLEGFGTYLTISAFGSGTDLYQDSIHYKGVIVKEDLEKLLK